MVDISDEKIKQMIRKPWAEWDLPTWDSLELLEANKPKEADKPSSSSKPSKAASDADPKVPLKNKPSSAGSNSGMKKKSKSRSSSFSSKSANDFSKFSFGHSSPSSSTSSKPQPSLTIISEAPKMDNLLITSVPGVKEKSSSHSQKKKKSRNEHKQRCIPLNDRVFNPEIHCGVVVLEDDVPCTRSLTCKFHSITLRRAVDGRSHPFDSLLAAHKKHRGEENVKSKKVVDESKCKAKNTNNSTPAPGAQSGSSSLPQPFSVGEGNTNASSGKSGSQIAFNATLSNFMLTNGKHSAGDLQ